MFCPDALTKGLLQLTPDEEMLSKYFVGIMDRFVLEGAKDIDYLSETDGMEQVVERIEADAREVDTTRPGTYTVRYKVTVNVENLERAEAYIREHPDAVHMKADPAKTQEKKEETVAGTPGTSGETPEQAVTEEAADSQEIPEADKGDEQGQNTAKEAQEHGQSSQDASAGTTGEEGNVAPEEPEDEKTIQEVLPEIPESVFEGRGNDTAPEETAEVIVEKEVTIVTPDEAEEIIRGGGEVWTDGSKPVRIEDLEKPEDAVTGDTAAAEKPAASERKEDTPEETGGSDHSAGDDGGREEEHQESVHTHDWVEQTKTVHHDETGHYEDVQSGTRTVVDEEMPADTRPIPLLRSMTTLTPITTRSSAIPMQVTAQSGYRSIRSTILLRHMRNPCTSRNGLWTVKRGTRKL